MYNQQLEGFFLFDAAKAAFGAVKGAVTEAVKSVTGVQQQTGAGTPMYVPPPPQPSKDYTPYIIGGVGLLAVLLLTQRRGGRR